jgi:hypothetical protein
MRTTAPYFSPNSAIAPEAFASSIGISRQLTSRLASTQSFTRFSMRASCSSLGDSKCE